MKLTGIEIVLGVTGGIAAYKSAEIVSRLRHLGADIHVIMTKNAAEFVAPLTFETLSGHPVVTDTFDRPERWEVEHVALAKLADLFVIAPATANMIAKMAVGIADDMLSTTVLATKAPVLVAPAMNTGMWTAAATQNNVRILQQRGVYLCGPDSGLLACGDSGTGRMSEPEQIVSEMIRILQKKKDLMGRKVLVTAGATRERLDPVRFLTNDSSGKMGKALAEEARDRGAEVTFVHGSVSVSLPDGVQNIAVESTQDLYQAVTSLAAEQNVIIQAAAPADYRFRTVSSQKLKKQEGKPLLIEMIENPDIASAIGNMKKPGQILVGFAAETEDLVTNAERKLKKKNLDLIVANNVTLPGAGFNVDTNIATLLTDESREDLPLMSKKELAAIITDRIVGLMK